VAVLATLLTTGTALADDVILKSGGKVSGRIVSRTATSIEVDVGAGRITVPVSSVVRIEEGRSPLQEYEERAGRTAAGDVDAWLALGDWASDQGLSSQAREAWNRALAAAPDNPRANAALGNAQVNGHWMSEDDAYRARGYVKFEGDWMTPAEHDAILSQRAHDDEQERRTRESEQRAKDAEARAAEAEARARQAEEEADQAQDGLPMWYGWGVGPVAWRSGPVVTPYRGGVRR
jgi:hypothetical protein